MLLTYCSTFHSGGKNLELYMCCMNLHLFQGISRCPAAVAAVLTVATAAKEGERNQKQPKKVNDDFGAFSAFLYHQRLYGNKVPCLQSSSRRTLIANLSCKGKERCFGEK